MRRDAGASVLGEFCVYAAAILLSVNVIQLIMPPQNGLLALPKVPLPTSTQIPTFLRVFCCTLSKLLTGVVITRVQGSAQKQRGWRSRECSLGAAHVEQAVLSCEARQEAEMIISFYHSNKQTVSVIALYSQP